MNYRHTIKNKENININSSASVNLVFNNSLDNNIDEDTYINNWTVDTPQTNNKNTKQKIYINKFMIFNSKYLYDLSM